MTVIFALVFLVRKLVKSQDPIQTLLTLTPLELLGLEAIFWAAYALGVVLMK